MRMIVLGVLVLAFCLGQTCDAPLPPGDDANTGGDDGQGDGDSVGDDGSEETGTDDSPPSESNEAICYHGAFECQIGPSLTTCGTWQFQAGRDGVITGTGTLTEGFASVPFPVALSGLYDPQADSITVALTSGVSGSGTMTVTRDGEIHEITGTWTHTDDSGPTGTTLAGSVVGSSCPAAG